MNARERAPRTAEIVAQNPRNPTFQKISLPIFHTFVRIRIDGQESIVTEYILSDSYHEFPEEEDQS